jgi:hypothetical protein
MLKNILLCQPLNTGLPYFVSNTKNDTLILVDIIPHFLKLKTLFLNVVRV